MDGRTQMWARDQPCIPAAVRYRNGHVCETAFYIMGLDPDATASCAEFSDPFVSDSLGGDSAHHEVQRVTLSQHGVAHRLTQVITFTAIECEPASEHWPDCIGSRGGNVALIHDFRLSHEIPVATATAHQIEAAFLPLADNTFSGVRATVLHVSGTSVQWRLELLTPWESCTNQLAAPLLDARCYAKVNVSVAIESHASCLSGGVLLGLDEHPGTPTNDRPGNHPPPMRLVTRTP